MEHGKKIFKIESKGNMNSFINFHLNSIVFYEGGYGSPFLHCAKSHPFNT